MMFALSGYRSKDVYAVVREKEQAAERVRREIAALLAVLPLFEDETPAPESNTSHDATFAGTPDYEGDLDDLNPYAPFTRRVLEGA